MTAIKPRPATGPGPADALAPFSRPVREGFEASFEAPTDAQARGWAAIAAGEHTLIHAPTGSGKTLAAFLWTLDRLATHPTPPRPKGTPGTVRVPGHEVVGEIVEAGPAVKDALPAGLVFVAPNMGCGRCGYCLSGNGNRCAAFEAIGITVDVVGLDAYDAYPPSLTKAQFDAQSNAVGGLNYWYTFAQSRNKLFGIGEWGVASGDGTNGGGDNAGFIQWMYDWFEAHAGKGFAYEFYFNNCDPNNVGSNLYRPLGNGCVFVNPNAAARYKQLYSAKG